MRLHDGRTDRQSEAKTMFLGGEKRLKQPADFFRKKAIEKTILRILRPSAFSHSLDPKRSSATHSRLHFGRPEPWEGRLAALLVSRDVLTKAQMSACGHKVKFSAQS